MTFFSSLIFGACSRVFYQADLTLPESPLLFTNQSIQYEIAGVGSATSIRLVSTSRPNGRLNFNFNGTTIILDSLNGVNLNTGLPSWILFDAKIGDVSGNNSFPSFEIDITGRQFANGQAATTTLSSLAFGNLTTDWTTFKINTKDLIYGAQLSAMNFKTIDVSSLSIQNILVESQDCTTRDHIVVQNFNDGTYDTPQNNLLKTYLGGTITPSNLYTIDIANGFTFKQVVGGSSYALSRFQINPQCKMQFNGISFSAYSDDPTTTAGVGFGYVSNLNNCAPNANLNYNYPDGYSVTVTSIADTYYVNFPPTTGSFVYDYIMELVLTTKSTTKIHISNIMLYQDSVVTKTSGPKNIVPIGSHAEKDSIFTINLMVVVCISLYM